MKNNLISISILMMLFSSNLACNKSNGDLDGDQIIAGTAYLLNTLENNSDTVLLKNAIIKIKYSSQQQDFLYKTYTDTYGKFKFTNVFKDKEYIIYSSLDSTSYPFYGQAKSKASDTVKLILYPDSTKFNAAIITVVDANNSPINGIKLYRFYNKTYFDSTDLSNAIDSFYTSNSGIVTYTNQTAGTYYLYSNFKVNNSVFEGKKSIIILKKGITKDTLKLE